MDYRKILKKRSLRIKILDILSFVPDKTMLKLQYYLKMGRKLNLKDPQRYTEKLQWYKLFYRNPLMIKCVDKYDVREYVISLGLKHILNECYGVFDTSKNIDFDKLPEQFVLKDTLGSGGNSIIICKDKSKFNVDKYIDKMNEWTNTRTIRSGGREYPYYSGKKHRIIAEKLLKSTDSIEDLPDYKIFCFNGKAKYIVIDIDRYIEHKRNFYDMDWNNLHITSDCPPADRNLNVPQNFSEMISIAEKLSANFPYVRVDLYNVLGKIYFGELTFYPWSGYVQFSPDSFDYELGKSFDIPIKGEKTFYENIILFFKRKNNRR